MEIAAQALYRHLPQVGELLDSQPMRTLLRQFPRSLVREAANTAIGDLRDAIRHGTLDEVSLRLEVEALAERVRTRLRADRRQGLTPVINATGVILQTNLGRAPLSKAAVNALAATAGGYCNLEYDLEAGARGRRGAYAEELLLRVLGCDGTKRAALVVNNCAAATFLALNSMADGGEVIVSRGELVEIGGGFRVPEILRKSGARLREVGTTNRTRVSDYADAFTPETRIILRVHRSNFEIVGFTEQPSLDELIDLGAKHGIPVMEDQGTGCILDLSEAGIGRQSSFAESGRSEAALVCASGDKLLGGPQCGLVVGQPEFIERLRSNPLYRAFRVDKLTIAALQATLVDYLNGDSASVPSIAMVHKAPEEILERCRAWVAALTSNTLQAKVVPTNSVLGGGTAPGATIPSFAVALDLAGVNADGLAGRLRAMELPVIARICDGKVLLDLRTVPEEADEQVPAAIREALR